MGKQGVNILVVEDDKNMGFLLKENLKMLGFEVRHAEDGEQGAKLFKQEDFDLYLLDIMLPKKDGLSLAKEIRAADETTPIIFLTARTMTQDKIVGFKAGCDDYLTKPFDIEELIYRIQAILKRTHPEHHIKQTKMMHIGSYQFLPTERLLRTDDEEYQLSAKEAGLLKLLAENRNEGVSRSLILKTVWGKDDYFTSKSLDVYLTKVRKYLKSNDAVELINIHGFGYKLTDKSNVES